MAAGGRCLSGHGPGTRRAGGGGGDRFRGRAVLAIREGGEKGEEVGLVLEAAALQRLLDAESGRGLVEEEDLRDQRGQTPRRLLNAVPYRKADARLAQQNPVVAGAVAELDVQAEALLRRSVEAVCRSLAA